METVQCFPCHPSLIINMHLLPTFPQVLFKHCLSYFGCFRRTASVKYEISKYLNCKASFSLLICQESCYLLTHLYFRSQTQLAGFQTRQNIQTAVHIYSFVNLSFPTFHLAYFFVFLKSGPLHFKTAMAQPTERHCADGAHASFLSIQTTWLLRPTSSFH